MLEMEQLSLKYGITCFEDADFPKIVEALEAMDPPVLEDLMTDYGARVSLASTLCTLFTMGDVTIMMLEEGDLDLIPDLEEEEPLPKPKKKKQTTH